MKTNIPTIDDISKLLSEFVDSVRADDKTQYERTIQVLKSKYELSPEEEAAIRIALSHVELLVKHSKESFNLSNLLYVERDIVFWLIAGDWDILNRRILSGENS